MASTGNYYVNTYGTVKNSFPYTESTTKYPGYHTFSMNLDKNDLKFDPATEYIEFDLSDVSLNFRCYEAIDRVNKLIKEASKKEKELLSNLNEYYSKEEQEKQKKEISIWKTIPF